MQINCHQESCFSWTHQHFPPDHLNSRQAPSRKIENQKIAVLIQTGAHQRSIDFYSTLFLTFLTMHLLSLLLENKTYGPRENEEITLHFKILIASFFVFLREIKSLKSLQLWATWNESARKVCFLNTVIRMALSCPCIVISRSTSECPFILPCVGFFPYHSQIFFFF